MDLKKARRRIISSDTYRKQRLSVDDIENGYWAYSTKTSHSRRLRAKKLHVMKAGDKVVFTNPSFKLYVGVLNSTTDTSYHGHASGWMNAGQVNAEFVIQADGYITVMFETPDNSSASLDNYDCLIDLIRNN